MTDVASTKQVRKLLLDVLRHKPESIGMSLDDEGFLPIEDFLYGANRSGYLDYTEGTLQAVLEAGDGTLFDIEGPKIRATYGHTTDQFDYPLKEPPTYLYYLIKSGDRFHVESHGIISTKEKWIPLEKIPEEALATGGKRRIKDPAIVRILAKEAWDSGFSFYFFCERWYMREVSSAFCDFLEDEPCENK